MKIKCPRCHMRCYFVDSTPKGINGPFLCPICMTTLEYRGNLTGWKVFRTLDKAFDLNAVKPH